MSSSISADQLRRGAVVYVCHFWHQSRLPASRDGVRQMLAATARRMGFATVTVIEDRPSSLRLKPIDKLGFRKLAADVCGGVVGAVFCLDATQLAPRGLMWRNFVDLCALSGTVLVDLNRSYDPRRGRDRKLLRLRESSFTADPEPGPYAGAPQAPVRERESKELPAFERTSRDNGEESERADAIRHLLLSQFRRLQNVREVTLWAEKAGLRVPSSRQQRGARGVRWEPPSYSAVLRMLEPFVG